MSRKIIRDFIKQADKLDNEQAARYFDSIMEVYEDSVHTPNERIAYLETDTLWLLVEYRKIIEAKDNTPEEKQQHHTAQSNLSLLLSGLIASTADKGIYLSKAFIKKYENVDLVTFSFGDFVRDVYKERKWQSPEPQQTATEAPQQPDNGSSGELAGNGNENAPEGENVPPTEKYIKLTPELQTTDKKAEKVFTEAYNEKWITERNGGGYQWKGFGKKSRTRKLAYLCAQIYETPSWKDIESFFWEEQLGRDWGNVKARIQPDGTGRQTWMNRIDNLIAKALQ